MLSSVAIYKIEDDASHVGTSCTAPPAGSTAPCISRQEVAKGDSKVIFSGTGDFLAAPYTLPSSDDTASTHLPSFTSVNEVPSSKGKTGHAVDVMGGGSPALDAYTLRCETSCKYEKSSPRTSTTRTHKLIARRKRHTAAALISGPTRQQAGSGKRQARASGEKESFNGLFGRA